MTRVLTGIILIIACVFGDNHPYSQLPPGNLKYAECPLFVCFGFDDNGYVDGIQWFADLVRTSKNPAGTNNSATFDGSPVRATFFITAGYGHDDYFIDAGGQTKEQVIAAWKGLYTDGHEIADHSWNHPHGASLSLDAWKKQMADASSFLVTNTGVPSANIKGFRTPYLEYSVSTMDAVKAQGLLFDCSIEFGYNGWVPVAPDSGYWNSMTDPKTHMKLFWPYTLDNGSPPGHSALGNPKIAGLWEVPVYTYLKHDNSGVVTGFDFNLWKVMDKTAFVSTLKHNFDLRRQGNRNPLTINAHTDYYTQYNASANTEFTKATWTQRREAVKEFIDYALQFPETRIVSYSDMLKWMKNPVALGPSEISFHKADIARMNSNIRLCSGTSVIFSPAVKGVYTFTLINLQGRTMCEVTKWCNTETNRIFLGNTYPAGTCFVRIRNGKQIISNRAVIVR